MQSSSAEAQLLLDSRLSSDSHDFDVSSHPLEMKGTKLGAVRAYWLGTVVCMAGFLFGYDSGIVGKSSTHSLKHTWDSNGSQTQVAS